MTLHYAITAFTNADDRWQRELVHVYGARAAGDARYDPRRNRATLELARLAGVRDRAQADYNKAWAAHLAAKRALAAA